MIFAQFYTRSPVSENLIEACGDRGVIILDGRNSRGTHHDIATQECYKRGYLAYQLCSGRSFLEYEPISKVITVYMTLPEKIQ